VLFVMAQSFSKSNVDRRPTVLKSNGASDESARLGLDVLRKRLNFSFPTIDPDESTVLA
tara:strand:+ start:2368 stop:2544 length:177 start_codon:yes stop_codon:yes gene_type:complete